MSGPVRMAVDVGRALIRVAVQQGRALPEPGVSVPARPGALLDHLAAPGGGPRLVAGWLVPAEPALHAALATAVAAQRTGPPDQLVLLHPGCWAGARTAALRAAADGLAGEIVLLPAPVAIRAAAEVPGLQSGQPGPVAVLDVGWTSARAAVLVGGPGSPELLAGAVAPVGGDDLDQALLDVVGAALPGPCLARWRSLRDGIEPAERPARMALRAEVRRARELLATRDEVTVQLPVGLVEVPLRRAQLTTALAGLLDRAIEALVAALADAAVAPQDPSLTVLLAGGVARTALLGELVAQRTGRAPTVVADPVGAAVSGALVAVPRPPHAVAAPTAVELRSAEPLLPPPRRRRWPEGLPLAALSGLLAAALAMVVLPPARAADVLDARPPDVGLVAQYDYTLRLPDGWQHSGGLPKRRRTLLTPIAAPDGSDLISVEQAPLGYDADAEPARAQRELRSHYDAAVASGSLLEGIEPGSRFGGRPATRYRQRQPERGAVVDWYVIFERDAQVSVGCQHTEAGRAAVVAACSQVVGSLRIRHPR